VFSLAKTKTVNPFGFESSADLYVGAGFPPGNTRYCFWGGGSGLQNHPPTPLFSDRVTVFPVRRYRQKFLPPVSSTPPPSPRFPCQSTGGVSFVPSHQSCGETFWVGGRSAFLLFFATHGRFFGPPTKPQTANLLLWGPVLLSPQTRFSLPQTFATRLKALVLPTSRVGLGGVPFFFSPGSICFGCWSIGPNKGLGAGFRCSWGSRTDLGFLFFFRPSFGGEICANFLLKFFKGGPDVGMEPSESPNLD